MTVVEFQAWCLTASFDFANSIRRATAPLAGKSATREEIELALDEFKKAQGRRAAEEDPEPEPSAFPSLRAQVVAMLEAREEVAVVRATLERAAAVQAIRMGRIPDDWSVTLERRRDWRFAIHDERGRELDLERLPPAPAIVKKAPAARGWNGRFRAGGGRT